MEKLNITSIYSLTKPDGQKSFFYTVKRPSQKGLTEYSYYVLTKDGNQEPHIRKIHHAINLLQDYGREFKILDRFGEEYKDFILELAQALKPKFEAYASIPNHEKSLKKVSPWNVREIPKKK